MASDCTDIDVVLRQINQRLRKLEKSDSEKTEEIGRLNRVINQKDVEIHNLKTELASTKAELAVAKERIKELEGADDDTSSTPGKPEKNSSNSSIPPSQESIASRELRRTKSLRKPSGKPSGGQPGHKGHTLQTIAEPDVIVKHEPVYCKCCGRLLIDIPCQKIRKTQIVDIKVVVETCEEQYYEKVCECGCVNNCEAPNCRIKYGDNLRALVTYLNVVQCIPFKRIAELISDLSGQNISEGTVQNILKENSGKADCAYEEIRKRLETASVVGADETGATVGKHPEIIEYLDERVEPGWVDLVNRGKTIVQRGKEASEQIDILGDDGVPVEYHDRFWKSELIDFVILQQDAFDAVDANTPLDRQRYMYNLVLDICDRKFGFDDFQSCVEFYKSLINLFKQLNYSEWESDKFAEYRARIDEMVAAKESNK